MQGLRPSILKWKMRDPQMSGNSKDKVPTAALTWLCMFYGVHLITLAGMPEGRHLTRKVTIFLSISSILNHMCPSTQKDLT